MELFLILDTIIWCLVVVAFVFFLGGLFQEEKDDAWIYTCVAYGLSMTALLLETDMAREFLTALL